MGAEAKAKQEAADKAAAEKAAAEAAAVKKAEEEAKAKLAAEEARIRKAAEALAAKQKKAKEEAEAAVLAEANKISENVQKNNTAPIAEIAETIIACDHLLEQCLWMEDNADYPSFGEMYCYMDGDTKYGGAARCCAEVIKAGLKPGAKCKW